MDELKWETKLWLDARMNFKILKLNVSLATINSSKFRSKLSHNIRVFLVVANWVNPGTLAELVSGPAAPRPASGKLIPQLALSAHGLGTEGHLGTQAFNYHTNLLTARSDAFSVHDELI